MHQIVRPQGQLCAIIQSSSLRQGINQSELGGLTRTQQKTIPAIEKGREGTKLDMPPKVIASPGFDMQIVPRMQGGYAIEHVFAPLARKKTHQPIEMLFNGHRVG